MAWYEKGNHETMQLLTTTTAVRMYSGPVGFVEEACQTKVAARAFVSADAAQLHTVIHGPQATAEGYGADAYQPQWLQWLRTDT